ncbi:MAG: methylmalonyl Co-A mutase-associated GTPase MeaB [Gemmataceae bacterium]
MPPEVPLRRRPLTVEQYVAGVLAGETAILARTITLVESMQPVHQEVAEEVLTRLLPHTGRSLRVGITGAPGAGKSTFIEALGMHLVALGRRVAVLAVDPSSTQTGGSILGDKTRMTRLSTERGAYIRPSPSAGTLGGVARKTREALLVCEAAGFDVVLVETVGVGQSETVVAEMTDCFLALMLPGAGDELQGIKRGLLELVDVIAVNKADGPTKFAAELAAGQFRTALQTLAGRSGDLPAVLTCSAREGTGVADVWEAITDRHSTLEQRGTLTGRRAEQNRRWLWALVDDHLRQALAHHPGVQSLAPSLEGQVVAGTLPPAAAARRLLEAFGVSVGA